jgi:hypothetical protein
MQAGTSELVHSDNDRHHRVAEVEFDFKKRSPPQLRCIAWFK